MPQFPCRSSGDMNTGIGNIIIVCAILNAFTARHPLKVAFFDDGDDFGCIVERVDLPKLEPLVEHFRGYGYELILEPPVDVLEQVVFCRSQPVFNGVNYTMVRQFDTLTKDVSTYHPVRNGREQAAYLKAIAKYGLSLNAGVPVHAEYFRRLDRLKGRAAKTSLFRPGGHYHSKGMEWKDRPITHESRVSYWRAFGVMPSTQLMLENFYRTTPPPSYMPGRVLAPKGPLRYGVPASKPPKMLRTRRSELPTRETGVEPRDCTGGVYTDLTGMYSPPWCGESHTTPQQ